MSELRDYQRVIIDNIMEDISAILDINDWDDDYKKIQDKIESRIESYDHERWEQLERDLPGAILRAVESIKC